MRSQPPASVAREDAPPSKTRRKQQMHALQDLGEALVALDADKLASLDLPEKLADAIRSARTITRHEAKRRQLQYIGKLMRDVDAEPLRAALTRWTQGSVEERAHFALLERWRDRVLREPEGVQAFVAAYPNAHGEEITRLVAEAREERIRGGPPHKSRALFRLLKRMIDEASAGS
jgi:ribosome-associated protein